MNEIKYEPKKLSGNWDEGWALDLHTAPLGKGYRTMISPEGYEYDHTYLGHLVYRLKYELVGKIENLHNKPDERENLMKEAESIAQTIGEIAYHFLRNKGWQFDRIIPVPPSIQRKFQPLHEIAKSIGGLCNVPVDFNILQKVKSTSQLKSIDEPGKRQEILNDCI